MAITVYMEGSYGTFQGRKIEALMGGGEYLFTRQMIARALGIDPSAVVHCRKNNPDLFGEGPHYRWMRFRKKRRLLFTEAGFLNVCEVSSADRAVQLRQWIRETMIRHYVDRLLRPMERRLKLVEKRLRIQKKKARRLEGALLRSAGELTATEVAIRFGWETLNRSPHNEAVILAAENARFDDRGLIIGRLREGPARLGPVAERVFTAEAVRVFGREIDSGYRVGQRFRIDPVSRLRAKGRKRGCQVRKVQPAQAQAQAQEAS